MVCPEVGSRGVHCAMTLGMKGCEDRRVASWLPQQKLSSCMPCGLLCGHLGRQGCSGVQGWPGISVLG